MDMCIFTACIRLLWLCFSLPLWLASTPEVSRWVARAVGVPRLHLGQAVPVVHARDTAAAAVTAQHTPMRCTGVCVVLSDSSELYLLLALRMFFCSL
jgi:hypothetical protein